jgi:hypothetical protein
MTFLETFAAVFVATIIGQVGVWWFKKEIEYRLDKHYEHLKSGVNKVIKNSGGNNMKMRKLSIVRTSNGKILVDEEIPSSNMFGKADIETYTFDNVTELCKWIEKTI